MLQGWDSRLGLRDKGLANKDISCFCGPTPGPYTKNHSSGSGLTVWGSTVGVGLRFRDLGSAQGLRLLGGKDLGLMLDL